MNSFTAIYIVPKKVREMYIYLSFEQNEIENNFKVYYRLMYMFSQAASLQN